MQCRKKGWYLRMCAGFSQDRVNFHRTPGRGTAGRTDSHLAKQSRVFHSMCRHAGFQWGGAARREFTRGSGVRAPVLSGRMALCVVRFVVVFSPYLYHYCSCSLLFAVLLNCPYPDPPVFCLFLSILLRTPVGGGAATWRCCCRLQPKPEQVPFQPQLFYDSMKIW